jgi:NAD(P)-dependent dehydrogenase (short-subunit alcohol dehydrogenase family)
LRKIIIAGSRGYLGKVVTEHFRTQKNVQVLELDIQLGHDLCDEKFVKNYFSKNKADYLINIFALNDHVDSNKSASSSSFDISLDSLKDYFDVNVSALFSVCREFARENSNGGIVNFSSIYGLVSPRNDMYGSSEKHIGYGITKAAVIQLTRHLAVHFAPNIRVNCIAPGGVVHNQDKNFIKMYSENSPMGRMMQPKELVGLVSYLCSDESTYMTGSVLTLDGGWTSW